MKTCKKCGAILAMVSGYEWTITGWIKSEPREIYHECVGAPRRAYAMNDADRKNISKGVTC